MEALPVCILYPLPVPVRKRQRPKPHHLPRSSLMDTPIYLTAAFIVTALLGLAAFLAFPLPSPPLPRPRRPLVGYERVYASAGATGGAKVIVLAFIDVPLATAAMPPRALEAALRRATTDVVQSQPMLAAALVTRGEDAWLDACDPLDEIDVAAVEDVDVAAAAALEVPFETAPASALHGPGARRVRTLALRFTTGPGPRLALMLQLHHAVCDGVSAIDGVLAPLLARWRSYISAAQEQAMLREKDDAAVVVPSPACLPLTLPELSASTFSSRGAAWLAVARSIAAEMALPRFAMIDAFAATPLAPSNVVTRVYWRSLSADAVAACRAACRARGVTFNSLLHAALARAAVRVGVVSPGAPLLLRSSVSLRAAQVPPLPSIEVGYCVGSSRTWLTAPNTDGHGGASLWETATADAAQAATASIRSPAGAALHAAWALAKEVLTPVLLGRSRVAEGRPSKPPAPPATLLTSNVGDRSAAFAGLESPGESRARGSGGDPLPGWRVTDLRFCSSVASWRALPVEVTAVTCGEGGCGLGFAAPSWRPQGRAAVSTADDAGSVEAADAAAKLVQEALADDVVRILQGVAESGKAL